MIDKIKAFYQQRPWSARLITAFFIFILLLITARIALSPGIIYGATSWLKKQGIEATIEAIDINIFDGTITLKNASGNKEGKSLFHIGRVYIHWQWQPLSNKTIKVTKVDLDSLDIKLKHYKDSLIIGGVNLPLSKAGNQTTDDNKDKTNEQVKAWAASLGEVVFSNLNICYLQSSTTAAQASDTTNFIDYCVSLKEMSWTGTIGYANNAALLKTDDLPLSSTGDFTLNGLNVTDNRLNKILLSSKSNTLKNVSIEGLNHLHIDQLAMNSLSLLQRDDKQHIDALRFQQLLIDDISLSNLNNLQLGNISISNPGAYLVKLNNTDWEYQTWIPQLPTDEQTNNKNLNIKNADKASSFKVALKNLTIDDSDLCYLDTSSALYYCLTLTKFNWDGTAHYDTKPTDRKSLNIQVVGNLELLKPMVRNQTIERNFLDVERLTLTKLKVTSSNAISIENFTLNKFSALQRSTKENDDTLAFDKLAINKINYIDNNIAINSISLSGLKNTLSKNKDGQWEYDKWLIASAEDGTDNTKQEQPSVKNKTPFIVSLNTLNISTDNKITFTDNSTKPAMVVGLNKLRLDIKNIKTNQPDTDSRFKLFAKTTRHSTIDIEGTARPFAKKVSIDATGKLKGFDLRAASPEAKKAIGHIIKSGQMDADLKILAVDGILDSNIALSLYQFNIKAVDKESAKKLDAKFGMPLNQTLVLLRDKDDSIHLDIPITGDVSNPNFNPMDAIIKATSKAATVTLITFYTPYGLIYAGGNLAFNLATALNFDPIAFKPGSAEISSSASQQLDGLTKLLTEKPQVHLTLCGATNRQDTFALFPALKEMFSDKTTNEENNQPEITLTDEQLLQLNQLARDRQINSKNYLVKQRDIEHDRLILCAPEHKSDDDAVAGVEIVI